MTSDQIEDVKDAVSRLLTWAEAEPKRIFSISRDQSLWEVKMERYGLIRIGRSENLERILDAFLGTPGHSRRRCGPDCNCRKPPESVAK